MRDKQHAKTQDIATIASAVLTIRQALEALSDIDSTHRGFVEKPVRELREVRAELLHAAHLLDHKTDTTQDGC